jgi:hypothetical protein
MSDSAGLTYTAQRLQLKIDEARWNLRVKEEELEAKMESVKKEGNEKIARLEAHKATAASGSQALLERRLGEVRSHYDKRMRRLRESIERRQAAHAATAV